MWPRYLNWVVLPIAMLFVRLGGLAAFVLSLGALDLRADYEDTHPT